MPATRWYSTLRSTRNGRCRRSRLGWFRALSDSRTSWAEARLWRTVTARAAHEATLMSSATFPGRRFTAPSQPNTSVWAICHTRWTQASSMVIHEAKNDGPNRTRFFLVGTYAFTVYTALLMLTAR